MTTSMTIHRVTKIEKKLENYHNGKNYNFTTLTITATQENGEKFEISLFLSRDVELQLPQGAEPQTEQLLKTLITGSV